MDLVKDWKNSLLKLKDEPFFDLIKNYLGPVQTPYHKPSIINSLEKLLLKTETRERLFALLNDEELKICGSVLQSGGIETNDLRKLFDHQYTRLKFLSLVENLIERLILYRDTAGLIKLNPLLSDTIGNIVMPPPVSVISTELKAEEPWLNEDLLTAYLSLVNEVSSLYRQDGSIRKRTLDVFRERLGEKLTEEHIQLLTSTAAALSLIENRGDKYILDYTSINAFFDQNPMQRYRALFTGVAAYGWMDTNSHSAWIAGRRISDSLISLMEQNKAYSLDELVSRFSFAENPEDLAYTQKFKTEKSLNNLIFSGLLTEFPQKKIEGRYVSMGLFSIHLFSSLKNLHELLDVSDNTDYSVSDRPPLLQPTFEVMLPPDCSGKSKAFAAGYLKINRYDRLSHYEFNESIFVDSVRSSNSSATILENLKSFGGDTVPQNVLVTASGWLNTIRQIEISTGTVVKVAPEMIPLMEDQFASAILESLAPGVYFIKPEKLSPFLIKWRNLGYADPGEIRNHLKSGGIRKSANFKQKASPLSIETRNTLDNETSPVEPSVSERSDVSKESVQLELEARLLKLDLSADQTVELQAKIDRKIILFPDQIRGDICRIGRLEARGIDFHAKLRIIEDVMNTDQDLLEIDTPEVDDSPVLVYPLKLEKNPGNPEMTALVLPGEKEQTFKIRRAVRIRKRKRSLFY